jgi:hypothetical protein
VRLGIRIVQTVTCLPALLFQGLVSDDSITTSKVDYMKRLDSDVFS